MPSVSTEESSALLSEQDKALLTCAAMAMGFRIKKKDKRFFVVWKDDEPRIWNPLRYTEDAEELATSLNLTGGIVDHYGRPFYEVKIPNDLLIYTPIEGSGEAAVEIARRLALTRAAMRIYFVTCDDLGKNNE